MAEIKVLNGARISLLGGYLEIVVQECADRIVNVDLIEHGKAKFRLGFREQWGTHYLLLANLREKTPAPATGGAEKEGGNAGN